MVWLIKFLPSTSKNIDLLYTCSRLNNKSFDCYDMQFDLAYGLQNPNIIRTWLNG